MRSLVLVILCGVAALFFSKPGDALTTNKTEEEETSYSTVTSFSDDAGNENITVILSDMLDQSESPDINVEEVYLDEEVIYPLDEEEDRRLGNVDGLLRTSKGIVQTTQYGTVFRKSNNADSKADKKVERQKIKRRKTNNANSPKPLKKKKKGGEIKSKKTKKTTRVSNKKVVRKKQKLGVANKTKKDAQVVAQEDVRKQKRCRPKKSCKKVEGKCKKKCVKKEVESSTGKCKGRRCSCCVKKVKMCKQKGECVGQGTCRKSCLENEIRAGYLSCTGKKCTCCLPDEGPCGPTIQHGECTSAGGTCKPKCDGERVVAGLCPGPHCSCCIPETPCDNTDTCRISGGQCKPVCLDTEVRLPGNCGNGRCFCCGPPPTDCTQTPTCPGTCSQKCKGVISLENTCLGSSCLCCLDCSPKTECINAGGTCKSVCGCGEKELSGGCSGGGCKCCVGDVLECKDQQTCTNCIYTPLCTAEHIPHKTCASTRGCSCC